MTKSMKAGLAELDAADPEWAALRRLAARYYTRILKLPGKRRCMWFYGGHGIKNPGMSFASMERFLRLGAGKRPPVSLRTGEPLWDAKPSKAGMSVEYVDWPKAMLRRLKAAGQPGWQA